MTPDEFRLMLGKLITAAYNSCETDVAFASIQEAGEEALASLRTRLCEAYDIAWWQANPDKETTMTELKVKRLHPDAKLPTRAHAHDAGLDLYALKTVTAWSDHVPIRTGIAVEIPPGYVGLIWGKSGLASDKGIGVLGGVIDSGYTGEIGVILSFPNYGMTINAGTKIAQLLIQKVELPAVVEVDDLDDSERGDAGFGSTGA